VARGVGGERHLVTGRADSFALGDLRFNRPLVNMEQAGPGRITAPGAVGNIGGQLLGRCRVTFDYPHHRVAFEAGPEFRKPFEAEMSGATISRDATGWSVRLVNPDTPASEAGLREGDVLTQVDDQPAATLDPAALRKLMQTEGRAVRLGVRRGDRDETVTLVLRRIL
jgi:PDZ domain-containing secreted protein